MKRRVAFCIVVFMTCYAAPAFSTSTMSDGIFDLQQKWAVINYQTSDKEQQEAAITALADEAAHLSQNNPDKAEPLIWQANILCTKAALEANPGSLDEVSKARDLLLQAKKINPRASGALAYGLLGWIYHKVPGWPIGFGDDEQAKRYLDKAIALNPNGLDINFYYGNFLYDQGEYTKAKSLLEHALKSVPHPNSLADRGRRKDIEQLLQKVNDK